MLEGIIVKGYSGFYYVQVEAFLWECSLRGRYRIKEQSFLVGDRVLIKPLNDRKAVIEEVLERTSQLLRPPVANVEQVVLVMSLDNPATDLMLLDRLLILVECHELSVVICFNKTDLAQDQIMDQYRFLYGGIGYPVVFTSVKRNLGLDELRTCLRDKVSVMAGPSGAGKSSLLNAMQSGLALKTGKVSDKARRGRHTTRHVELLSLESGGFVADTPGFSRLDLPNMKREELAHYFPEMAEVKANCRFTSCLHQAEPNCAVRTAWKDGVIDEGRYAHYLYFLKEVIQNERRY